MTYSDLIPKFEVGERVKVKAEILEIVCPNCGYAEIGNNDPDLQVTIVQKAGRNPKCPRCESDLGITPEGWYITDLPKRRGCYLGAPYTLLERVEGSR